TPAQSAPLQRAWAAGQIWPSGQGPGLTSADLNNIKLADPYWACTPTPAQCPSTVDPVRFTLTSNQDFIYLQPPPGGQPNTQTYTETNTFTTTQGQSANYSYSQTFGVEQTFSALNDKLSALLSSSSTMTTKHDWESQLNQTNSSTSLLSITGPPCTVVAGVCNPVYAHSTQFDLYQDNLYGTFLLNPVN